MGISQYDPAAKGRPAWNAGKQVGVKRPLKVKQIWLIRFFLDREGRMRDRALFDLAIDSKLRGCDLVKMKIGSLVSGPAMRHAFTVETKPMTTLRGRLLKRISVARCPFCGISESSTLDHYLPKEQHPEFSVFPKNLVPSCAVCNTRKRDRIVDEGTNVRMFLHPCYDVIPDMAFLVVRARMEVDALILSYRLTRPAGMTLRTFQHLQSHFNELDLADRYRRMGLEHLGGQYPALRRAYGPGEDAERVAEKLIEGAEDLEEASGPNYWLAKLYRSLARNEDFCDGGFKVVRVQTQHH